MMWAAEWRMTSRPSGLSSLISRTLHSAGSGRWKSMISPLTLAATTTLARPLEIDSATWRALVPSGYSLTEPSGRVTFTAIREGNLLHRVGGVKTGIMGEGRRGPWGTGHLPATRLPGTGPGDAPPSGGFCDEPHRVGQKDRGTGLPEGLKAVGAGLPHGPGLVVGRPLADSRPKERLLRTKLPAVVNPAGLQGAETFGGAQDGPGEPGPARRLPADPIQPRTRLQSGLFLREADITAARFDPAQDRLLRQAVREDVRGDELERARVGVQLKAEKAHVLVGVVAGDARERTLPIDLIPFPENRGIQVLQQFERVLGILLDLLRDLEHPRPVFRLPLERRVDIVDLHPVRFAVGIPVVDFLRMARDRQAALLVDGLDRFATVLPRDGMLETQTQDLVAVFGALDEQDAVVNALPPVPERGRLVVLRRMVRHADEIDPRRLRRRQNLLVGALRIVGKLRMTVDDAAEIPRRPEGGRAGGRRASRHQEHEDARESHRSMIVFCRMHVKGVGSGR